MPKLMELKQLTKNSWPQNSLDFGLAITVSHPPTNQLHIAAIYRSNGCLMMGHLESHLKISKNEIKVDEDIGGKFYWMPVNVSEYDQKILAAKIDAWIELNQGSIPYSTKYPGGIVFKNDLWVGCAPGDGLTCATFIVKLFEELGIPFVNLNTWEPRSGDEEWCRQILDALRINSNMDEVHIQEQLKAIGNMRRVRPADIAAASFFVTENSALLTFDMIFRLSECVENALLSLV